MSAPMKRRPSRQRVKRSRFAAELRRLRRDKGLSLRDLEASTGISNGYLSQLESGRAGAPSPRIIQKLCTTLDYPYVDLMRVAGHLSAAPAQLEEQVLHLRDRAVSLAGLSDADQESLLLFIEMLRTRHREGN